MFEDWPAPSVEVLEAWCSDHGIKHSRGLQVTEMEGGGWKILAGRDYTLGEYLVQIPKSAILSLRTSSLPKLASKSTDEGKDTQPLWYLALALLHEIRLGRQSTFWGYIQILPRKHIPLPVLWPVREIGQEDGRLGIRWLAGTEAQRDLDRKSSEGQALADLEQFFNTYRSQVPCNTLEQGPPSFLDFLHAYSLVCTRAFIIDLFHTIALCPFADLLNHSTTSPHTSLAADDFVCHVCGSLPSCEHDILNSGGYPYRLESLPKHERNRIESEPDYVEMRMESTVRKGEQVFNSYGDSMNDGRLLVEWGFVEEDSAGGDLTFDLEADLGGDTAATEVWGQLDAEGILDDEAPDPGDHHGDQEDKLITSTSTGSAPFRLNQDGQLSLGVIAQVLFTLKPIDSGGESSTHQAGECLKLLVRDLEKAWACAQDDEAPPETSHDAQGEHIDLLDETARKVVARIVEILDGRLARMFKADLSLDELFTMRDALTEDEPLQRMGMTVSINERRLLESTREKWIALR